MVEFEAAFNANVDSEMNTRKAKLMSQTTATHASKEERRLLKKKDLATTIGCSTRQIDLMVKSGKLPKPFYCGDSSPRWRQSDIDEWLERLATSANSPAE